MLSTKSVSGNGELAELALTFGPSVTQMRYVLGSPDYRSKDNQEGVGNHLTPEIRCMKASLQGTDSLRMLELGGK